MNYTLSLNQERKVELCGDEAADAAAAEPDETADANNSAFSEDVGYSSSLPFGDESNRGKTSTPKRRVKNQSQNRDESQVNYHCDVWVMWLIW